MSTKTPEEIKSGLECWAKNLECTGSSCPYWDISTCKQKIFQDALEYINDIEGRAILSTLRDVEIVTRCKDCKRWGAGYPGETDKIKCCQIAGYLIGENGYCLYAEAKDEG